MSGVQSSEFRVQSPGRARATKDMRPAKAGITSGLRVVCCGCGVVLKEGDGARPPSHGICRPCVYRLYPDMAPEVCRKEELAERYGGRRTLGFYSGALAEAYVARSRERLGRLSWREVSGLVLLACVLGMGGVAVFGFGWRLVCAVLAGLG